MIIKNKKLVNEFMGMMVNVRGGEDGMVGLNEFMYGMYGRVEDVKMLKRDIFYPPYNRLLQKPVRYVQYLFHLR